MSGSSLPLKVASFTSVLPPGPLHIVALVITVGVTWIVVSILLSGLGFPWIQQLFASECGTFPHPARRVAGGRQPDLQSEAQDVSGSGLVCLFPSDRTPGAVLTGLPLGVRHSLTLTTQLLWLDTPIPTH